MSETYLMVSGAVFALAAMAWNHDDWGNFFVKAALWGMTAWSVFQVGQIHGVWR
jgi:hypothetical protein